MSIILIRILTKEVQVPNFISAQVRHTSATAGVCPGISCAREYRPGQWGVPAQVTAAASWNLSPPEPDIFKAP